MFHWLASAAEHVVDWPRRKPRHHKHYKRCEIVLRFNASVPTSCVSTYILYTFGLDDNDKFDESYRSRRAKRRVHAKGLVKRNTKCCKVASPTIWTLLEAVYMSQQKSSKNTSKWKPLEYVWLPWFMAMISSKSCTFWHVTLGCWNLFCSPACTARSCFKKHLLSWKA